MTMRKRMITARGDLRIRYPRYAAFLMAARDPDTSMRAVVLLLSRR